jgi:glycosyltransferase involved in cell wall biosynthesis
MADPKISVVIISYNMARELPRTIKSFSPSMQQGVDAEDYELIVVDNGSARSPQERELKALASNLVLLGQPAATVSPVPAIHRGLEVARGDLIGVCIDGARMASPGLIAKALTASRLHERPAIGTLAFHLGPDLQRASMLQGYSQEVEDALLTDCRWEDDGYRLFDISTLAGSSVYGWFVIPAETSALFLRRTHWCDLGGGYDRRFRSPGGGLANLDLWRRLAADPTAEVIMLLGEGTFHQIHGGIVTNAITPPWTEFHEEFISVRGTEYTRPMRQPVFFGSFNALSAKHLASSVELLKAHAVDRA